jgi:hypothetical protein
LYFIQFQATNPDKQRHFQWDNFVCFESMKAAFKQAEGFEVWAGPEFWLAGKRKKIGRPLANERLKVKRSSNFGGNLVEPNLAQRSKFPLERAGEEMLTEHFRHRCNLPHAGAQ